MRPDGPLARLAIDRTAHVRAVSQVHPNASHWKAENREKIAERIIFPKVSFRTRMYK
jgi:hypothetical protein